MDYSKFDTEEEPEMKVLLNKIREAAFEVRTHLGPGYLEKVYQNSLILELTHMGLIAQEEVPLDVRYKNVVVGKYEADIIVNSKVIIELKAVKELSSVHPPQLINYLTATGLRRGFLLNYGGDHFQIQKVKHPDDYI